MDCYYEYDQNNFDDVKQENKELKSNIESLENQMKLLEQLVSLTNKQVEVVKKDEAKRYRGAQQECMRLMEENQKLKKQTEELNYQGAKYREHINYLTQFTNPKK